MSRKNNFLRPISLGAIFLLALTTPVTAATEPLRLSNNRLQLAFDSETGRLQEFIDKTSRWNFVAENSTHEIWELRANSSPPLRPSQAKDFHFEKTAADAARLTWRNFSEIGASDLVVEVLVQLEPTNALSRWQMAVWNCGKTSISEIHFPRLENISRQKNEFLAAPSWMGQLISDPRAVLNADGKPHRREFDYPGMTSMQCFAFYSDGKAGLYLSCDDTNALRKSFVFSSNGKGAMNYEMIHLPENASTPREDVSLLYHAVIGTFTGDWFTAAEMYRSWATNQWWARESRLARSATKSWAANTALWVWNRGRSENVIQPAVVLQQKLGLPVSAMWHWWHGCAYDIGFPEYLPPREGLDPFTNALTFAHRHDTHAIVYMNQRLWGMTTKSWSGEGPERFAVKAADGKVHPEIYNSFTKSPCASMCMGTEFWRNKYAGLAKQAVALGVDGIYMDQACSSLSCYDPTHGHPLGGGSYWMNGFRMLAEDIRNARPLHEEREQKANNSGFRTISDQSRGLSSQLVARNSPSPGGEGWGEGEQTTVLAGEGVGESWLPYLNLMLSLQVSKERYSAPDGSEPIPFFQSVYHPFAIQYGNYSSLTMPPYDELWPAEFAPKEPLKLLDRKFSRQFYLEQARAFLWGQQPTIANFQPSQFNDRRNEIEFVLRLARLRARLPKFFLHGTFLRSPEISTGADNQMNIDISRLSIYAGQQGALTAFQKRVPKVLSSAWLAPDSNVAIAVANISDEKLTVNLKPALAEEKTPKRAVVYRHDEHGRKKIGRYDSNGELKILLPGRSAAVFELSR